MKLRLIILISISVFLFSCKKNISLSNLNGDKISCFGHAGMGSKSIYPANTLQSFEACLNKGADGTEMDMQVTKDGVLVIFHNDNLSGTTACGGIIRDLNWDEINDCRINSLLFKNLDIVSFSEFIKTVDNPFQYTYTFDCKCTPGADNENEYYHRFANAIVKTIRDYSLEQNVFVENSDPEFLNLIKGLNSNLKLFLITEQYESGIKTAVQNNFYGLSASNALISRDQVNDAHSQNIRVTLYGVQTNRQNYAAIEKQPDFIQTDDLDYLLRVFGKLNRKGNIYAMLQNLK